MPNPKLHTREAKTPARDRRMPDPCALEMLRMAEEIIECNPPAYENPDLIVHRRSVPHQHELGVTLQIEGINATARYMVQDYYQRV